MGIVCCSCRCKRMDLDLVGETLKRGELSPWYLCIGEKDGKALSGKLKSAIATVGQGKEAVRTAGNGTLPGAITEWLRILYQRRRCGWPLRELLLRYETYRDAPDGMTFSLEQISGVDAKTINAWNDLVVRLVSACAGGGPSVRPPIVRDWADAIFPTSPCSCAAVFGALSGGVRTGQAEGGRPLPYDGRARTAHKDGTGTPLCLFYDFGGNEAAPRPMDQRPGFGRLFACPSGDDYTWEAGKRTFSLLSRDWLQDFLRQDGAMLAAAWEKSCGKWSVSRNMEQKRILKHLAPYARQPIEKDKVGPALEALRTYQAENDMVVKLFSECREL